MPLASAHEIMSCIPGASGCINPEQFIIQIIKSVQLLEFPVEQQAKRIVCVINITPNWSSEKKIKMEKLLLVFGTTCTLKSNVAYIFKNGRQPRFIYFNVVSVEHSRRRPPAFKHLTLAE